MGLVIPHLLESCTENMEESWRSFPPGFSIGVGSSHYQIEGAVKEDGRGESCFDRFIKCTQQFSEGTMVSADIGCDGYHHIEEDVKLLKKLGVDFYRFSISWSRILPTGDIGNVNEAGIDHYNRLINLLLENDIQPFVTMFHFDYPQVLQDLGGWTNPIMVDYFVDFAELLLKTYGDRVKLWITHNEPRLFSVASYAKIRGFSFPILAPGICVPGIAEYLSVHHLLLSHSKVYHLYDKKYKPQQKGKLGICLDVFSYKPEEGEDEGVVERVLQFQVGWIANPIFGSGDYPDIMKRAVEENSRLEGRRKSRLPKFTKEEIIELKGASDFFGVNHYTTYLVKYDPNVGSSPSFIHDKACQVYQDPRAEVFSPSWLTYDPESFRKALNWLKITYNNPTVFICENGSSQPGNSLKEELNDDRRIKYYKEYLEQCLKAINLDKCKIIGYSAWSFLDSFEWDSGFQERFGFYHVDFNDPHRPRRTKKSALYYRQIITSRRVDPPNVKNVM